jgi:hypothetical protein
MKLRRRGQIVPMVVVVFVMMFTLAGAAANVLSARHITDAELRAAALEPVIDQRRLRIATLRAVDADCNAPNARELVRLMVQDGQWSEARELAERYEQRCGTDPIVRRWHDAPRPHPRVPAHQLPDPGFTTPSRS